MSHKEICRLTTIQSVIEKRLPQKDAATVLGLTVRQIKRLVKGFKERGPVALISKKRGLTSNRKRPKSFDEMVIGIIREKYPDFGPTLACEKLACRENIKISVESARKLMIAAGLWKSKKARQVQIHQPRARRGCYGELIQIDGSPHAWFEDRGAKCTLIVFIDDATSRIQMMRFFESETTFAYFHMMKLYIERYGQPVALYSDQFGVFRVNAKEAKTGTGYTQFGRAMEEIGVELIHANSPQAKGRVERANSTLQDRLIKELRLENISDMETANQFLDRYIEQFNEKFSIPPREPTDMHKASVPAQELELHFSLQKTRDVQKNLTIQYKNKIYAIEVPGKGYRLRQAVVTVCEAESGEITLLHKGQSLSYKVYDKKQYRSETVSRKELEPRLKNISLRGHHLVSSNHPWKLDAEIAKARALARIAREEAFHARK